MAKKKSSSSGQKKDIKVTAIILLLFMIAAGVFYLFNHDEPQPNKSSIKKNAPVAIKNVSAKSKDKVALENTQPLPRVGGMSTTPIDSIPLPKTNASKVPQTNVKKEPVKPGSMGRIAFIIDDWGQSVHNCQYLRDIADPLTVAILPSLRKSDEVAKCAKANRKAVILHLPLQAYHNNDPYPTDYIIKTDMKPSKVEAILKNILEKMPYIEGVNNHMGSKATENEPLMRVILTRLKKRGYYFVDSMTAPNHSVCHQIAKDLDLPFAKRDIFLDNINTREEILIQMNRLIEKAKLQGSAIAIGHDRPLTMQIIKEQIPLLKEQGFAIVDVKELLDVE